MTLQDKLKKIEEVEAYGITSMIMAPNLNKMPDDTFNMVFDTLKQQLDYQGSDGLVLREIQMYKFTDEDSDAIATMSSTGVLALNSDYFTKDKSELDKICKDMVESHFHPKGCEDSSSLIIHELGHARFNKYLQDLYGKYKDIQGWNDALEEYSAVQYGCGRGAADAGDGWFRNTNVDMFLRDGLYADFVGDLKILEDDIRNSEYMIKMWGGKPTLSLYGLVQQKFAYTDGISDYAGRDIQEMMAEAYASVMMNGYDKASFVAQKVYDKFLKAESAVTEEDIAEFNRMRKEMGI